jgi:hypothetical protein
LNAVPLEDVNSWLDGYRRLWNERMDRLEDLINRTQSSELAKEHKDVKS